MPSGFKWTFVVATVACAVSACGSEHENGGGDPEASDSSASGSLDGGGSGSQEKAQAAWRAGFQADHADAGIDYEPVGSGAGRENFVREVYSFAGTDSALNDDGGELGAATERCGGEEPIQVPAYVSPIAVIFNLEGVDSLNLSAPVIADIFAGRINTWNDPAIAELNEGVSLTDDEITPVHRRDDSGVTESFTTYLVEAGQGRWTEDPAGLWPATLTSGERAEGTAGVLAAVVADSGSIGYADASAAGDLGVVSVQVGDEFNAPSTEGAAQVVAHSPGVDDASEFDMAVDLDRTTTEPGSYPLLLVSYLLACQHYDDQEEADLVNGYLGYIVSDEGQQAAADEAGAAPLDPALSKEATELVNAISAR